MESKKRNISIELLRIVSMIMIVSLHYFENGQIRELVKIPEFSYFFVWFVEVLSSVCVNCFIIVSSWYIADSKFKIEKLLYLWIEIIVVNVLCYSINYAFIDKNISIRELLHVFSPIVSGEYWFMTAYFIFYLFSPFLTLLVKKLDDKQLKSLSLLCLALFTVIPFDWTKIDYGFHFVWFIVLFIITSSIKRTQNKKVYCMKPKVYLIIYFAISLIAFGFKISFDIVGNKFGFESFGSHFRYYTFIFTVINSFVFFLLFRNASINNKFLIKFISLFAPLTLGVYLIHMNPGIINWLWLDIINPKQYVNSYYLVFHYLICVIIVYLICSILTYVLNTLFRIIKLKERCHNIGKFIETRIINRILENNYF